MTNFMWGASPPLSNISGVRVTTRAPIPISIKLLENKIHHIKKKTDFYPLE